MIVKRKIFGILGETRFWARLMTPVLPMRRSILRLILELPGTIFGAIIGFIIGLVNEVRHVVWGIQAKRHRSNDVHEKTVAKEKSFSDVPLTDDFSEYCKAIPRYKDLAGFYSWNHKSMKDLPEKVKVFIYKGYPSFFGLETPEKITEYRKDYMQSKEAPGDYAEILFTYGGELVYVWDFDKQCWYVQDRTYTPQKEWMIKGDVLDALRIHFDPKKNPLLEQRIKVWEEKTGGNEFMKLYCEEILEVIDAVRKDHKK